MAQERKFETKNQKFLMAFFVPLLLYFFFFCFLISFIFSINKNADKINIPYFGGLYQKVQVDVVCNSKNSKREKPRVFFDNEEIKTGLKISENHFLFSENSLKKISKVSFKNLENGDKINIYIGNKGIFQTVENIENIKNIEINNSKTFIEKGTIILLSFFYNFRLFLVSYLFLFLFVYCLNRYKLNLMGKINKTLFILLIILSFLFRISQLNNIPFWDDEIYVLRAVSSYSPITELFSDPGNPPLFFIIFKQENSKNKIKKNKKRRVKVRV